MKFELKNYHKLIGLTDVAMNIAPNLKEKTGIIRNAVKYMNRIGYKKPKVAVIGAVEVVNEKMPATIDAAILSKMGDRGQFGDAVVEGPLALDLAIDAESAKIKKIDNEVVGDADCLLFPNIESGNVFYKANTKLAKTEVGAIVAGAKVPCILSSRGDSVNTKLYSIALGALIAG